MNANLTVSAPGVRANDQDADQATIVNVPANGTLQGLGVNSVFDGGFTYIPDPGFSGVDTFRYTAPRAGAPAQVTITVRPTELLTTAIAAGTDDAEEHAAGQVYTHHKGLQLVQAASTQTVGLRFADIGIPRDATIHAAHIQFSAHRGHSGAVNLVVQGEASPDAATFTTAVSSISSRPRTDAQVPWAPAAWAQGRADVAERTPDLAAVVQELVNQEDWRSGQALGFIVTGAGKRVAAGFEKGAGTAARLTIEYSGGADPGLTETIEILLTGGMNDVEERNTGVMYTHSTDLEFSTDQGLQTVGMRFTGIAIPRRSEIVDAFVRFTVDEATVAETNLSIRAHATGDAPAFTTVARDLTGRPTTQASVPWAPAPWPVVDASGEAQETPPLTPIVQELVNRRDFDAGAAMAFVVTGEGRRTARSSDRTPDKAPRLVVEFIPAPPPELHTLDLRVQASMDDVEERADGSMYSHSTDIELVTDGNPQTVGLRFQGVSIPAGAEIVNAWLQFTTDETTNGDTSVVIRGESSANAPAFTSVARNVSGRVSTQAQVPWSIAPWAVVWEAGAAQESPSVTAIVQEIVDNPDYAGDAMVFTITGSGRRTAESFDGNAERAPLLHVEYLY
jgi:hypothetical protein